MHAGLLREEGRALERLDHQVVRDVAREPEVDGRVDEGLHDEEDVRRAGPGDRGRHGHEPLVVDLDLVAERRQEHAGLLALGLGGLGGREPDGHALAELGRRVGHAPDDLAVPEVAHQRPGGRAGEDADDELPRPQPAPDLAPDSTEHLGLDPEQDDVRALDRGGVRIDRPDPVRSFECLAPVAARVAGDDLAGGDEVAPEQAGDDRLGHDAGADGCDRGARER